MTDDGGSDAIWRPPRERGPAAASFGRALPPPVPWSTPQPDPVLTARRARRRRWTIVGAVAAGAVLIGGAVIVYLARREPDERRTAVATIRREEVRFADVELAPGVVVSRTWRIDDDGLRSSSDVQNRTAIERWVVYDEIVPAPLQGMVAARAIDGPHREALADHVARFTEQLGPGRSMRVTFTADLAERPSLDELEAWTEAFDRAFRTHLTDPELSPVDGDVDGVPDALDDCREQPGRLRGCPDADGDGVADHEDRCVDVPGPLEGCPDRDGDGLTDRDDECPDDAGDLVGCPDADDDGFGEGADDHCPDEAGPAAGCPDGDRDGRADLDDQCASIPGEHGGCPDANDVRWAIFDAFEHHIKRLTALPAVYDPDGNQIVEDGRGYCAEVRGSFVTLRDELRAAVTGPPPGASAETVALAREAADAAAANIELLEPCLAEDVPFPWENPDSGWINGCALSDALVERVTGQPYECNSTW